MVGGRPVTDPGAKQLHADGGRKRMLGCSGRINNCRGVGGGFAGSVETVINKVDALIENPPPLCFQTSVIADPGATLCSLVTRPLQ